MSVTLTVFFDDPFYTGLVERREGGKLTAARVVFGAEPSEPELLAWVLRDFASLRPSPAVETLRETQIALNPKRRQRQAARAVSDGIGTRSQQALQLAREASALERKTRKRARDEAEAARKFSLKQEKKKARHRGH